MKRFSFYILILVCAVLFAGCKGMSLKQITASADYQNGYEAYEDKKYEKALKKLQKATEKGLTDQYMVYAYSYMGHCSVELGNAEQARSFYETALAMASDAEKALCYTNLGVFYRKIDDFTNAEACYLQALTANEAYVPAIRSLGVLYSINDKADEAVTLLQRAAALTTDQKPDTLADLAFAYGVAGDDANASRTLEEAIAAGYSEANASLIRAAIEEAKAENSLSGEGEQGGSQGGEGEQGGNQGGEGEQGGSQGGEGEQGGNQSGEGEQGGSQSDKKPTSAPTKTPTKAPTKAPTLAPTKAPTLAPTKTPVTEKNDIVVVIDPGHQSKSNLEKEPVGPGATELKTKVSVGTQGTVSKVPEYQFNLQLSKRLRDKLEAAGYTVYMTRDKADVNISNKERAEFANAKEADIFIRVHADGADNRSANGIAVLYPSLKNPYISHLSTESKRLAQAVQTAMCESTGAKDRGIVERDDLTGTNFAKMPVIVVEAGFMTNEEEEAKLISADYQELLAEGILIGVEKYFK